MGGNGNDISARGDEISLANFCGASSCTRAISILHGQGESFPLFCRDKLGSLETLESSVPLHAGKMML
jgi:hypothetical protein